MPPFENAVKDYLDARISTLARIKTRSLGADTLVLSALTVLAYAQLEGGVKEISGCVIKDVNRRKLEWGEAAPRLLKWRNQEDLARFRSTVNFEMIGESAPFAPFLKKRVQIKPINRRREFNQMTWGKIKTVYEGFGLSSRGIERYAANIGSLVDARNDAAHHGAMPTTAAAMLENQVRDNVRVVEDVLTDLALQALAYFENGLHRR